MTDPLATVSTRNTPQSRPADARQVPNSAGGFSFRVDPWQRLRRFLVLGVDGGSFYASDRELALENAQVVLDLVALDGLQVVREVLEISESGRAPKQQPALFTLAVAIARGDVDTRRAAEQALPRVARTGTHIMTFAKYVRQFRGWGRILKRGVGAWFTLPTVEDVAYQVVKYRQREGYTPRDLLRLASPATTEPARRALFNWVCTGGVTESRAPSRPDTREVVTRTVGATADDLPRVVQGFQRAQSSTTAREWVRCVREYRLSWEMLPTQALNERDVWDALLDVGVPLTALVRQLPRLTRLGLLDPLGRGTRVAEVTARLTNAEQLRRARVHPLQLLIALKTYGSGHGERGSSTWIPSGPVVDALDAGFYASFGAVEVAGNGVMLALDVSGSMTWSTIAGMPLTPRDASAALALVTASVEPSYQIVAFSAGDVSSFGRSISPLAISPRQRLDDVIRVVNRQNATGTDCALPMLYALENNIEVHTFVIYTDSETWYGQVHPHQALVRYRQRTGIPARLVVVGMVANNFTIADPGDAGMLDVVGFDLATPNLIASFARGEV